MKKIHLIAIGGAVMHNVALMLHRQNFVITGSDDDIFEPSSGRLLKAGLMPAEMGWFPERITPDLDAVIVGMHAKKENPELLKAQSLGLRILSFPELVFELSSEKHRIVIAGSHGKTTISAMICHVLKHLNRKFSYVLGAQIEGFEYMVNIEEDDPLIIIEGDEYPTSPLDPKPKFLHYRHHVGVISGIAWDHINAYPDMDSYVLQFDNFADATPKGGALIFSEDDDFATIVGRKERDDVQRFEYGLPTYDIKDGVSWLKITEKLIPLLVFGEHNLRNLNCAKMVCNRLGVKDEEFYQAIQTFKGAKNRLEKVGEKDGFLIYKDFAHAPSKLKATLQAVRKQYPNKHLIACMELHTYSSLNKDFIQEYQGSMDHADTGIIYFDAHTFDIKKIPVIQAEEVLQAFGNKKLEVYTDASLLKNRLKELTQPNRVLLLMSSGNFGQLQIASLLDS